MQGDVRSRAADLGSTSISVVAAAKRGEHGAFQNLARLYGPLVYSWARETGLQPHDADDVTQQVLLCVLRGLRGFEHEKPARRFRPWLWTIARNEIAQFWRRRAGQPQACGGTDAYQALQQIPELPPEEPTDCRARSEAALALRALEIAELEFEPRTMAAVRRYVMENRTAAEVGAELGMTAQAVYEARRRVLRRVRELLAEE